MRVKDNTFGQSRQGYGMIASSEMYGFFEKMIKNSMDGNGEQDTFNILYDGSTPIVKSTSTVQSP